MKIQTVIQVLAAALLALGMNGLAMAKPVDLSVKSAPGTVASITNAPGAFSIASTSVERSNVSIAARKAGTDNLHRTWFRPPVPEPSVYLLMLAGVGLVGFVSYRRRPALAGT